MSAKKEDKPTDEQLLHAINALDDTILIRRRYSASTMRLEGRLDKWAQQSLDEASDIEVVRNWLFSKVTCETHLG